MLFTNFYNTRKDRLSKHFTITVKYRKHSLYDFFAIRVKKPVIVSLRNLYVLPFTLCKDVLYECLKKLVKIRKEDLNAFFTASLRNRKFKISCCESFVVPTSVK